MYLQERERTDSKAQASSVEEWLRTLHLTVKVESLAPSNLVRTVQLLNKTNQMNLSTRRMTEQEFKAWSDRQGHRSWVFYVSDRFGDSGLTGILSMEVDGERARIVDFVLSCRVMGRKVEETMLHWAVAWSASLQLKQVVVIYTPTAKNAPCLAYFRRSGLCAEKDRFTWDIANQYLLPDVIKLIPPADGGFGEVAARPSAIGARVLTAED